MISDALNAVSALLEEYREVIRKANSFSTTHPGYLENYKRADLIEKRIKTELYKYVSETIEKQLDDMDQKIRDEKVSKDA